MEHVRMPSARRLAGLGLAGAVAVAAVTVTASPAIAEAPVLGAGKPNAIPGAYIVVLKDKALGRPADLAAPAWREDQAHLLARAARVLRQRERAGRQGSALSGPW
jgi:hypothetical protein